MTDLTELHQKLLEILEYIDKICKENNIKYTLCAGSVLGAIRHKGFIPWDDDLDVMMMRSEYNRFLEVVRKDKNEKFFLQEELKGCPYYFSKIRLNGTTLIEKTAINKKWKNMHQGIFVDVFPVDYAKKSKVQRFIQTVCARLLVAQSLLDRGYNNAAFYKKIVMSLSLFFLPFKKAMFNCVINVKKEKAAATSTFLADYNKFYSLTLMENIILGDFENKKYPIPADWKNYLVTMYGEKWTEPPSQKELEYKIHAKIFSTTKNYTEFLND